MEWLLDPFSLAFQQRALLAGVLAAVALAVIGTWVVIRGMTFLGDALVHGVIPGIALAVLFDFNVLIGAAIAAVVMIAGINLVHRQTAFSEDTGIGLLFAGMLSLGVIIISKTDSYTGSLTNILFGNALGVTAADIAVLAVIAAVTIGTTMALFRHFLVLSFNEQKAALFGLHPRAAHAVMLGLITLTIVGSFQTVGTLLVFGLLVGPPATAALLVRRVPTMMATAALIGALSVVVGLIVSYHANISGSATMAIVPIILFFVILTGKTIVGNRNARRSDHVGSNAATF
ncbi:Zinc ABC transporter, permease protein ZnuB [hydrothermal vent metagenome]|uniref:Zinc ABC transporter, permease protein ZnuB n=1 Tax=hydrothermal vent metagenome TaxID=652676 RepID=A0A3B0S7Y6_9ZZZZ